MTMDEERCKSAFQMPVVLQDMGRSVEDTRLMVSARFNIDLINLMDIEKEGLIHDWPLLND